MKQIAVQYDASSFAETLRRLSASGAGLEVVSTRLEQSTAATRQWNEFVTALAAGYNRCAITRQQYEDGLSRVYLRLNEDADAPEAIRKVIADGQKVDAQRLLGVLDRYWNNLREFAEASGKEIVLERIEALTQQTASGQEQILEKEALILVKLREIEQRDAEAPVPTPTEVRARLREVRKELPAKADASEQAYKQGCALLDQYRFREAIPYLQQALSAVPLSEFYLALGRAYRELPDLPHAETTLQQGLAAIAGRGDDKEEASLSNALASTLQDRGDGLDDALTYSQRALHTGEKVYGPDHPSVARDAGNIGTILRKKGDLGGAIAYTQRALNIDEKVYGSDSPKTQMVAAHLERIRQAKEAKQPQQPRTG